VKEGLDLQEFYAVQIMKNLRKKYNYEGYENSPMPKGMSPEDQDTWIGCALMLSQLDIDAKELFEDDKESL